MPVTKPVIKLDEGGSGNASTTVSGNKSSVSGGYNFSPDSPFYASAQRLAESKRKKEEEEKRKTDEKNAQYFSSNIQSFVRTVNDVSGHIGKAIGSWAPRQTVSDSLGMYDSLSENYKKLQDAFVGNDYLRESMSDEDYRKTSEAMDAIGKALEDGTAYVRQAGEVYGQFGNADEYNRHVQLSGMSADDLQKQRDALDASREAKKQGMTTLTSSREQKKALDQLEEERPAYDAERALLTSYLNNAKYNEGVNKYGVDPKNMTYSEIMGIVNSQAAYRRNPDVYDFVRSFYDSQNENYWYEKKAEEFVDGLDAHERYLYKKVIDMPAGGLGMSGAVPANATNPTKVNEIVKEISERTGDSEDVVKQNIELARWYFDSQKRAEQQKNISEYVGENVGNAALANTGSILIKLPAGVAAFIDQTGQTIGNKLSGTDAPVNPNTPGQSLLNVSNDIRDATRKQIEKKVSAKLPTGANLGVFVYDTIMNTADVVAQSLVGGFVGRGIGSALGLGASGINKAISATTGMIASSTAAADTVQESLEDGYSNGMAVARGAIAGAIESIVEAVQIDRLMKGLAGGDSAIKAVLKGALSEGTEEVVTNILTEDVVEFFFDNGTRISRLTAEYEAAGYSKEGALRKAALDVIGQDAETFVSAAITGAVFGGTEAAATRANDKANTKLAQDGINNELGGIGEIEFLKNVNLRMEKAQENLDDDALKDAARRINERIERIRLIENDVKNNSSMRNVIGESGIQQEVAKMEANIATLTDKLNLIRNGKYDPTVQAYMISLMEEDLTKTTEEQAKSQRNVLKAAQMYLSAFGSEKKAVEVAKKTAAQENARAAELSAERNRLTQALTTADETQKVEINRRLQEIGREIKRTARNVIRAGKVEKALGDQYRSAINSALGGNEKELSKRLTNALGREVKVAYDDNAKGFSSMKTGADSSTLTVNPELILRTENALRQEFGEEYTGNLAKEKLVHEIAHAAARSDANFDAKVLEIYHLLRDNGLITDDDIDEAATREAYKDTLKRYMATEPAKAEVRRLVEAGNAEADAIAAVENAYIGEELVAQTLEWMERATNGQLSREILGEKRNVFVQALNRIAEIFRSVAAKLKGVDNVNAAKTAGFADKIERFAREFAERGVAEMNEGKAAVSQESAGATQSADNAQGNSGEVAVASSESEASTGTQEEDGGHNSTHAEEENAVLPEEPENEQRAERVQKAWEIGEIKKMLGMEDFDDGGEDSESYAGDEAQTLNPSLRAVKQEAESDYAEFRKWLEAMESSDSGDSFDTADSDGGVDTSGESEALIGTQEEDERQSLVIGEETAVAEEGDTRYSIKSMRHDIAEGKMFDDLVSVGVFSREEADTLRYNLNKLVNYMIPFAGTVDMNEEYGRSNRPFRAYKPNSDPLYVISLDFSTLCRKRLMTQYVIEQLQLRENRPMTAEEQIAIRSMLLDYRKQNKALQVACAMCYVEAARLKAPKQMERFFTNTEDILKTYFAKKDSEFNAKVRKAQEDFKVSRGYEADTPKSGMKGKDVTALNKMSSDMRRAYEPGKEQMAIIETAKKLPRSTFLTAANLTELSVNHPEIYDAYTSHIRASTRSKSLEGDIPYYYGDSDGIVSDSFIENVNAENGFRFDSWSDFQMKHMLDMITAVIELSVRKSKMHGYTKFPEMVRIFGKTGMMFNLSGVAAGNGFDADGNLAFSDVEGMAYEDAVKLRSDFPETAGFQCIGVSNDHIRALLRSGDIDYVIPYHTSGLNATLRRMVDIYGWKDYTGVQNAKKDPNAKKPENAENWQVEPVWSEFFVSDGKDGYDCMKKTAQRYIDMCHERGLIPKFDDFTDEPNYWKLLIDRKMVNQKTGALIEQKPVRPDFDFGLIEDEVKREVSEYDPKLEQDALNYVVDNFDAIGSRIRELKKIAPKKKLQTVGNEVLQAYSEGSKVVEDERQSLEVDGTKTEGREDAKYSADVIDKYRNDFQKNYEMNVDAVLNGTYNSTDPLIIGRTPDVFEKIGFVQLPVSITPNHVYSVAKTLTEAKKDNRYKAKVNYHGLGADAVKGIMEKISDPIMIVLAPDSITSSEKKRFSSHRVIAIVELEVDGNRVIAPIEVEADISTSGGNIDSNLVVTYFDRENIKKLISEVIALETIGETAIYYGNKKRIGDFVKQLGLQLPALFNDISDHETIIRDIGANVNRSLSNATQSKQFKRWFGDWQNNPQQASKVVNRDGTPRIVYHYTDGDFTVFDPSMSGNNQGKSHGDGIYVSTNPSEFSYAGKNKMELYANIRNPFEMQLTGKQADYVLDKYASAHHDIDGNDGMYRAHAKSKLMSSSRVFDYLNQYAEENGIKTSDILKDLGFDGVHDGSEWVAFDSNQLKSATDNIGLFDANNDDIRYSLSDEQRMKRQAENIAFLKKQIQRGRSYAVSPSALDKVWTELRRGYGIDKADEQTVRDMFKIVDDMSMHKMDADEGMARLNAMAREVLTNVYQVDDRLMRENEAFIQHIRSTPLSVPAENESDLGGKYGDYRNENRRYVNLSREGTPVESVYEQICDMFPGILDRSVTHPADQIHEIVDAMRSMDPEETPVYSEVLGSAAESFVSDIMAKMDRYSRETFRAKSERDKEILRENAERQAAAERNRSDILRAREAEEYEKRVKRMETQNRNTVNAYEARIQGIETAAARDAMQYREIINNLQNRMDEISVKNDRRDYSNAIRRDARVIRSVAVSPNQKRYIPEEHRKTIERIAEFLDKVSRYNGTYRMDMADMSVYKDIQSLAPLYGEDFADTAAYLVNEIDWTAGADMAEDRVAPMVALRVANNAYKLGRLLRTSIARQNRMVLDGKNRNANYISGELIDSLNNRRNVEKEFNTLETDEKGKILSSSDSGKFPERLEKSTRKTRRWISLNTMDGYSFLRRMGKVGESLYDTLRAAQSEQIMHVQEYVKTLQEKLLKDQQDGAKGVDLSRYIGDKQKTVTVTLSNRKKYTMTAAQAMTIVTLYEREAGKSHIENGGVRLVHPKDKTLSAAVALKAEDVAAIAQNLDEDDRRVMKVMNDFIREQCTEWGNEATLERYGFHRFNAQHYFPITVDRNALPSNVSAEGAKDYLQFNVQNVGFAKAADASAKAPVVIDSFISVINRHVEGMATYAAYLNAEDIVNRLMSAPGVKDAMQRSLGTGSVKYMTDMMTELKQGNRGGSEDALTQWWNKSAGHYKSAAVSYNLSTALKQPLSIIRAAAVLDPKYILAAKRVPRSGTGKAAHEEMMQYSGIGVKKSVGYSDVGISRDINAQIGYEKKDLSKKVRDVSEFGMALAGYMDEWTWDSIWIACREEVKDKKPDLTANHEAFMNEVAKRFAEVVAQTQVVDSPLDSSPLSRSKSPLARNVFAFTSEPIKGFNLLMNAMDDLINAEKGSIRQKQAAAQMARTAVITLVGWAAEASISAAFQMIRDEDDDEGEIAKEFGVKFGKQMMSNAYNVVPYVGQLIDIVRDSWEGYDFTDMGIAPLEDVINSAKELVDILRNPENKSETPWKAGRDLFEAIGTFFGVPIRNFARDAFAVARLFFHSTDWYIPEYEMQKWFYNPKSSTAREKHEFNSLLTDAYLSGNKKAFEHIYNDMRSMGLSPQTIMNGIAKDAYAQDITSTGSTLTRYTPGSDAWYIGMKGIFDRDLTAPDGLEKELTRLYKATEEKGVLPKYKSDSYTVDGEAKELSVKDHEAVLAEYSKLYYEIATILRNSPAYKNADDTLKAYWMAQAERYAGAISIYRVDSEYNLRTKWWEKMKDKPYYDVAGYIITNLKPSKEDE